MLRAWPYPLYLYEQRWEQGWEQGWLARPAVNRCPPAWRGALLVPELDTSRPLNSLAIASEINYFGLNMHRSGIWANHDSSWAVRLRATDEELGRILHGKVISGLDGLRVLAVGLVLIDHFLILDHIYGTHPDTHARTGSLGVMVFFVLSGFLITWMLLKEYRKTDAISLSSFYRRRAYRIFPTFYCCWILTTLVYVLVHQNNWKTAALSFFYFMDYGRAFAPENVQPWMQMWITWSLAIEEKFYLLWPLLLLFLLKRPSIARNVVAVILGQWTYRAVLFLVVKVSPSYFYSTFDMRADALLIGCLVAILLEKERTRLFCCHLLRSQWWALLAPFALLVMLLVPAEGRVATLLAFSAQPVLIAVMLLHAVYWGEKSWTVCRTAPVRLAAHLSYALYLYHPLAGKITKELNMPHLGLSAFALTLMLSIASYYLIERPFMRMRDLSKSLPAAKEAGRIAAVPGEI